MAQYQITETFELLYHLFLKKYQRLEGWHRSWNPS